MMPTNTCFETGCLTPILLQVPDIGFLVVNAAAVGRAHVTSRGNLVNPNAFRMAIQVLSGCRSSIPLGVGISRIVLARCVPRPNTSEDYPRILVAQFPARIVVVE